MDEFRTDEKISNSSERPNTRERERKQVQTALEASQNSAQIDGGTDKEEK